MKKPKVIVLCGSSRFTDVMAVCAWLLERDEGAIAMGLHLLPGWYSREPIPDHLAEHEGVCDKGNIAMTDPGIYILGFFIGLMLLSLLVAWPVRWWVRRHNDSLRRPISIGFDIGRWKTVISGTGQILVVEEWRVGSAAWLTRKPSTETSTHGSGDEERS